MLRIVIQRTKKIRKIRKIRKSWVLGKDCTSGSLVLALCPLQPACTVRALVSRWTSPPGTRYVLLFLASQDRKTQTGSWNQLMIQLVEKEGWYGWLVINGSQYSLTMIVCIIESSLMFYNTPLCAFVLLWAENYIFKKSTDLQWSTTQEKKILNISI